MGGVTRVRADRRLALSVSGDIAVIEVHEPGSVYPRDNFLYWGFPVEGLRTTRLRCMT